MSLQKLDHMTVEQLVERFVQICLDQDQALLHEDIQEVNRLFAELKAVERALKERPNDQRRMLIPLYKHDNMQVRVKAAKATLATAPDAAHGVLEAIRASNWQPQALEAGMSIRNLKEGIYKPT
jgi:hypothetical protein